MSVIVRRDATRDIGRLGAAVRSPARFAAAVARVVRRLERFPLSGAELGPSADGSAVFRFATVPGYRHVLVVHLPLPDGVDVVRVVDGRRDLDAIVAALVP